MNNKTFKIGRVNTSVTIFVPYDCTNRCNFCTTKHLYKDELDFDLIFEKMKSHIDMLINYGFTIFTLTGGEPLADLVKCKLIVDYIYEKSIFKDDLEIYINTSLPKGEGVDNIVNYLNDENNHITGISVSRHRNTWEQDLKLLANVFSDDELNLITKPSVRINCLLTRVVDPEIFVQRFSEHDVIINFRANYMKINSNNLHNNDQTVELFNHLYKKLNQSGCNVCDTVSYQKEDTGQIVLYHRGIFTTKIEHDKFVEINDIVINMFGDAYIDWIFEDCNRLSESILESINENLQNLITRKV